MNSEYYVYILSNEYNTVLYTGLTNDVYRRVTEHKEGIVKGFTKKYNVNKLVYFETHRNLEEAQNREYLIKRWKRSWKEELIEGKNPNWIDLFEDFKS